jgi:NAD(P)H-hydrate repair Nnr-like enzyme with NAD(P)H-hydrate dehydratase domain
MNFEYWKKQLPGLPLYSDIEWSKPETRALSGKLGIIGGNQLGFAGVAEAYTTAIKSGVGQARVLLPDVLKKTMPKTITDTVYAPTNMSGSLTKDAISEMVALGAWADEILLIGDAGRSSETAIVYEHFIKTYTGKLVVTRDAIDLVKNSARELIERPDTMLIASFAQLQKLFQSVYYPKVLTFSMQLTQLIEAVHKFTITYPVTIAVLHKDFLIIAHDGNVVSTEWDNPMAIWRGVVASKIAAYWLWNTKKPLEAAATAIVSQT